MSAGLARRTVLRHAPAVGAATLLALSGCAASPPPPAVLDLAVSGGAHQNPDQAGHAAPVAVRVYQLASASLFEQADVFSLIEHDAATLGADLLGSESFVLLPSEKRTIHHELKKGTQFIGVMALFQNIGAAQWRADVPVAASGPVRLKLDIGKLSVALAPA